MNNINYKQFAEWKEKETIKKFSIYLIIDYDH